MLRSGIPEPLLDWPWKIKLILSPESPFLKGSPEGSSDPEFRSSILCDVIEISG